MKIERVISWFDKDTEILQGEFNIDKVPLEALKIVFRPPEDDPLMYNPYTIYSEQAQQLKELLDIRFDFERYVYQVDCFQV